MRAFVRAHARIDKKHTFSGKTFISGLFEIAFK